MSSIESKRVQYRKYLERAGVIDALSKALIKLYEEQNKPDDAIRFVRKFMCEACPDDDQFDLMKADLEEANKTISRLEQELERLRSQIKKTPEEVAEELEKGFKELMEDEENSNSLLRKYFTRELLDEYMTKTTSSPIEATILDCVQSGLQNHNAAIGVYAADAECYEAYDKLFDPIIRDYHNLNDVEGDVLQKDIDWGNPDEIENLDQEKKYIISTRVRVKRNLEGYPLIPKMTEKQYIEIEDKIKVATAGFDGELTGGYFSLKDLDVETQADMYNRHILFRRGDENLNAAGAYRFWPTGRGLYHNPAETFLIWVNREDQVEVISMINCGDLGDTYHRLVNGVQNLEKGLSFARHPKYGNLAANPANLGTGLRASVLIRLVNLSSDMDRLKGMAKDLNLEIRGTRGQNTSIEDGLMDISNKARMGMTEFELMKSVQEGLVALIAAEEELEANNADAQNN